MSKSVLEILNEVAATSSRLEKEGILLKHKHEMWLEKAFNLAENNLL